MPRRVANDQILPCHQKLWGLVSHYWEPNYIFGHGIDHAKRTYGIGKKLCNLENGNFLVVGAACYLMDSGLNVTQGRNGHIERSIEIASRFIPQISELREYQSIITECINNHDAGEDFSVSEGTSLEAKIVRDCDTLDRMGFPGIKMTLTYGTWINRKLYSQDDPICKKRKPELNGFTLDYIRYLFELQNWLSTENAKEIGIKKIEQMERFMKSIEDHIKILNIDYEYAFTLIDKLKIDTREYDE